MQLFRSIVPFFLLLCGQAGATHIIGGELYYEHLGGAQYQVTLELYRDCGPDNTNGTGFDAVATIGVFNSAGALLFTQDLFDPGEEAVPVILDSPCLAAPPQICVATTAYTGIFVLPSLPGGYHLSYQRCCRTPAIVNLQNADDQGLTCTVQVPGPPNANNSSPQFDQYPPVVLCMNEAMTIDHSATDPDGDQLVYELCTPYQGGDSFDPAPTPGPPPYIPVVWGSGYSAGYPLDSDPAIAIDPATGILTATPSLIGSFAVGVMVKEFRDGVLLSEVIRDFKFDVVSCETDIVAAIGPLSPDEMFDCLTATFENESQNGDFWSWDFGDPNTTADTSSLAEPQWTYGASGTYTVTLIANPGWPCADTAQLTITTPTAFGLSLPLPEEICVDTPVPIEALGTFPPNTLFEWEFPPGAIVETNDGASVSLVFSEPGIHPISITVSADQCIENASGSLEAFEFPVAEFISPNEICMGEAIAFENLSTAPTPMQLDWRFGDGHTSVETSPVHHFDQAGTYFVQLNIATENGCVAADSAVRQITVHPLPVAGFRVMPNTVSMVHPEVEILDHAEGAMSWEYLIEGQSMHQPEFTYLFNDAGHVQVWQTVISEHGCRDSTSVEVFITDHLFFAPNAFTPNGDGMNDVFAPVVKGARIYELAIYDRYGKELFRSRETDAAWDGADLPQGIYTYTVHIAEFGTHRQEYKGHISLLR